MPPIPCKGERVPGRCRWSAWRTSERSSAFTRRSGASSVDLSVPEGDTALYVESIPALGYSIMEDGTKRSARIASRRVDAYTLRAYRTSLRAALAAKDKGGSEAIMAELQQMLDKSVWQSVDAAKLSVSQLKKVIRSHIFVKEKLDAAGKFVKMKARMVAGGMVRTRPSTKTYPPPP
jgi:hypothetical protein